MSDESKTRLVHGPEFQRSIIKQMMEEDRFCIKAVEYLKKDWFTSELKWFFEAIADHYKFYKAAPSWSSLQSAINARHGTAAQPYLDELQRIQGAKVDEAYLKVELTGFIRNSIFVSAFQQASQMYNSGSRDNAYEFTKQQMELLAKVDFQKEKETSFGDHAEVIKLAMSQKQNAIPTGIRAIDEAMGGGLLPQTWTTFLAGSNAGKSMLMPNLAYHAIVPFLLKGMRANKVFITVHEDEETPTKLRYLSRFSSVPMFRLLQPHLWTAEEKANIEFADGVLKDYVKMRFMYTTEATIEAVQHAARQLHKAWKFDLYLCDYGQCLSSAKFSKVANPRLEQEHIHHELKQLCLELGVAGAGGAQVNRAGHAMARVATKKEKDGSVTRSAGMLLRCTDVGEAWGIVKKSSNVITMNRSDEDIKMNRVVFLLDKVRNGRCPVVVECATKFEEALTHDVAQTELHMGDLSPVNPDIPPAEYLAAAAKDAGTVQVPDTQAPAAPAEPMVGMK